MRKKEAFWDYFWLAKFFLRAGGILPIGGTPSLWKSLFAKFLTTSPAVYGFYVLIPEVNYILFQPHTVDELLEAMTVVIIIIGGQFRTIFVSLHRRKITRLYAVCVTLWDKSVIADYRVVLLWARQAKLFSTAYFCAANFAVATFVLSAAVRQRSSPGNSTTRYYPFHYPEDFTPSPQYEIKYALQVMIGHAGMFSVVAADMTGTLLALNMCGQFALIRSWLMDISQHESIAREKNIKSAERTLQKCILRHQVVLDFCAELEEVVHHVNLVQIIPGMYVLAISGARLTESLGSYRYFGPLMLSISGLFFSCWPADNLSIASSQVAAAAYDVPWYDYSSRGKTKVAIMLMRSQRRVELTAGKFVVLSLETFSSIVSSSVSYFMVLYRFS